MWLYVFYMVKPNNICGYDEERAADTYNRMEP